MKFTQFNCHSLGTEHVPAYGSETIEGPSLNIYARILLAQPGDPITKTLINPHIVQSFRLHIPNTYQAPYYRDRQFLAHLINTAKSILEVSFPFPFFDKGNLKYILEADSLFFTYKVGEQYFFYRLNITHLRAMDAALRDEYLKVHTPQPSQFICTNGTIFDANYDIIMLVHNVRPRQLHVSQTQNEAILLMKINSLITEKIDAVGVVAQVLSIYHDYRVAITKPPTRTPQENPEFLEPPTPSMYHPVNHRATPTPLHQVVIQPQAQQAPPKPAMMYIPPYRRATRPSEDVHPQRTPSQERMYLRQMDLMKNNYTSPYQDQVDDIIFGTQEKTKATKRRTVRNRVLDPTTPWARTAEAGRKP